VQRKFKGTAELMFDTGAKRSGGLCHTLAAFRSQKGPSTRFAGAWFCLQARLDVSGKYRLIGF
jgi:hypothetical protein